MLKKVLLFKLLLCLIIFSSSCNKNEDSTSIAYLQGDTWGEKLGFAKDKRVIILHADDVGMCREANESAKPYLSQNNIQSASIMVPCPWADEFMEWYKVNPEEDVGIHLTLTSEWQTYRWGPISAAQQVPGLIDPNGFMWHDVRNVVKHATPEEVRIEVHAQIDKALAKGIKPGHIDTHMGTLYASLEFAKVYLNAAMEYGIPAMALELTEPIAEHFRSQGYPITDELIKYSQGYTLPKLDAFHSVDGAPTYEEKKQKFYALVQSLTPGITEIIFHPSIESDSLKSITNSWQQRVWEAEIFSDPEVIQFFQDENVEFTNWKEMMKRFQERT